jgi:IclR family acetate operon transcriptional repressor
VAEEPDRYLVRSVDKALRLVDLIAEEARGLSLTEAAKAIGTSKSATLSLLRTLSLHGYVREQDPGPRYVLGMSLMRLGDLAGAGSPLVELCRPLLRRLTETTGLTSRVAVADAGYPMFVERVDGPGTIRFHTPLGRREPPHTSSAGKAILSTLDEAEVRRICAETGLPRFTRHTITEPDALLADLDLTRRRGFAIDDEEDAEGVFCVAAAFFDHRGRCAGAVSATGIKVDQPAWRVEELGQTIRNAADELAGLLGGKPYAPAQEARP